MAVPLQKIYSGVGTGTIYIFNKSER